MKQNFSRKFSTAFKDLMALEGGYCKDLLDKGKETKFGLCKKTYHDLDIANITLQEAKKIYYDDFWKGYSYDKIRSKLIAAKVFHTTVNTGANQSHKILQRALRANGFDTIADDGIFGKTLDAANRANTKSLLTALRSESAGFYRLLVVIQPSQNKFIKGWIARAYK